MMNPIRCEHCERLIVIKDDLMYIDGDYPIHRWCEDAVLEIREHEVILREQHSNYQTGAGF